MIKRGALMLNMGFLALVLFASAVSHAQMTCFYEQVGHSRYRISLGPSRMYATPFHTDYSEGSILQMLVQLAQGGTCKLPVGETCFMSVDGNTHATLLSGPNEQMAVQIGWYWDESIARAAAKQFQSIGLCKGLKVKKAPSNPKSFNINNPGAVPTGEFNQLPPGMGLPPPPAAGAPQGLTMGGQPASGPFAPSPFAPAPVGAEPSAPEPPMPDGGPFKHK